MSAATLDRARIEQAARDLHDAFETARPIEPLSERLDGMTIADAYAVQRRLVELHRAAGREIAGRKIGLTSRELQRAAGIDQPDYGVIFDSHVFASGARLSRAGEGMIEPRLEAELAFVLDRELAGPGLSRAAVLEATREVVPVFEIVDSRIRDWRIGILDTIADNASGWGRVVGAASAPTVDLATVGMVVERDGQVQLAGAGGAVLGHPAEAVAWLGNTLAEYGEALPADQLILSGSFTTVLEAVPGHYVARFGDGLGVVELTIAASGPTEGPSR